MAKAQTAKKNTQLPSVWELLKKTYFELTTFWRPLFGVVITYAVLYFVFILGFSASFGYDNSNSEGQSRILQAFDATLFSFGGNSSTASSDATSLLQFLLFIIASLAFVWTLRHLQALKHFKIRAAYYRGTTSLIPAILVTIMLLVLCLPAAGGSFLVATAFFAGASGLELIVIWLLAIILLLASFALITMFWPAFYIACLPDSWPISSMRDALKITKKRRLNIARKVIVFGLMVFFAWVAIMFTIALISTSLVPYMSFGLVFVLFAVVHTYMYLLYRSLL
jgi:hypothetical protein